MLKHVVGWACTFALVVAAGCAAPAPAPAPVAPKPEQPATTVILLPDEDGKVGSVTVTTADDSRSIDQAFHAVSAMKDNTRLSVTQQLDATNVNRSYADLLNAEPTHPVRYLLYFGVGVELLSGSVATIPRIVETIRSRAPTEVVVIGHTDTLGSAEINDKLARERATAVEKALKGRMPSLTRVTVRGFGSKDQLVATPPNVNEPRNRRVEVVIL